MPQPHINNFYRIWFTWFDPIVLGLTVYSCIFTPADALEMLVPKHVSPLIPEQLPLMYNQAPWCAFMGIIFAVLLRASPDPTVWRIVQGATLVVDFSLMAVMAVALNMQGVLGEPQKWRSIEQFNMGFTAVIAVGRIAFLMGVGGNGAATKKRV
jgi:hypothetical protein